VYHTGRSLIHQHDWLNNATLVGHLDMARKAETVATAPLRSGVPAITRRRRDSHVRDVCCLGMRRRLGDQQRRINELVVPCAFAAASKVAIISCRLDAAARRNASVS
jgi:hypothetical protein